MKREQSAGGGNISLAVGWKVAMDPWGGGSPTREVLLSFDSPGILYTCTGTSSSDGLSKGIDRVH